MGWWKKKNDDDDGDNDNKGKDDYEDDNAFICRYVEYLPVTSQHLRVYSTGDARGNNL